MKNALRETEKPRKASRRTNLPRKFFLNSASAVLGLKLGLEALVALRWCPVLARGAV